MKLRRFNRSNCIDSRQPRPDCRISNWRGSVSGRASQFFGSTRVGHSHSARLRMASPGPVAWQRRVGAVKGGAKP
jgi:hypothetical protein